MEKHFDMLHHLCVHFKASNQEKKLLEEMEELKEVLTFKKQPEDRKEYFRNLTDEMADVLILLYQLITYHGLENAVDAMVDYKIQRTLYEKEKKL